MVQCDHCVTRGPRHRPKGFWCRLAWRVAVTPIPYIELAFALGGAAGLWLGAMLAWLF